MLSDCAGNTCTAVLMIAAELMSTSREPSVNGQSVAVCRRTGVLTILLCLFLFLVYVTTRQEGRSRDRQRVRVVGGLTRCCC